MNILVTGATGFIGGAVVDQLTKDKKYKVFVLVRNMLNSKFDPKVKVLLGDLENYKIINKHFSDIDVVINCAGGLPHHKLSNDKYWDINYKAVKNIVKASESNKIKRLVHISTVGIYGSKSACKISEESKPDPSDAYSKSKLAGENAIRSSNLNLKSIIIRPTIAYGPRDIRPVFLRLFRMIKKGLIVLIDGGKNDFHTIYIDNLVNIIVKSIKLKSALGQDFIVGDINCPDMRTINTSISKALNIKPLVINLPKYFILFIGNLIGVTKTINFISNNRNYNVSKYVKYFKIKNDISFNEGIKRTFDWYNDKGLI